MKAKLNIEVGAILRKQVRDLLNRLKWEGQLDYFESKSLLESRFTIKGDSTTLEAIRNTMRRLAQQFLTELLSGGQPRVFLFRTNENPLDK